MNKKKMAIAVAILIIIAGIAAAVIFLQPKKTAEPEEKKEKPAKTEFKYMPITYKVCDNNSCVHIVGSIHLGDKRINKIDQKLVKIFNESDYLALEVNDEAELDLDMFTLKNGQTIEDLVSDELYEKMENFSKDHPMYILNTLKYLNLGYNYDYIDLLPFLEHKYLNNGVDSYFQKLAKKSKKEILAFEKTEDQLKLLVGYSDEFYIKQIESIIDDYDNISKAQMDMYEAYLTGDEETITKSLEAEDDEPETEEEQLFYDEILTKRNENMINIIEDYLEDDKNVFIVVGAAHVLTGNSIIGHFRGLSDYTVETIK